MSLKLASRAENVLLVRQALNGLAETVGLDPVELNDISTAVSEACNNVVLHAYGGDRGPLEVEVFAAGERLEVVVRDHGAGISPRERDPQEIVGGIGVPVIRALSTSVEFRDLDGAGTEVRMTFATAKARRLERLHADRLDTPGGRALEEPAETTVVQVGPPALAREVLPRVLSALAVRANFSTDRISDAQLLADALAAHAQDSIDGGRLNVEISLSRRDLQLRIGPLRAGAAALVLEGAPVGGLGSVLERLADGHEISRAGSGEVLGVRLSPRR